MKSRSQSPLRLAIPAVMILTLYAWSIYVFGLPHGEELTILRKDVDDARASAVSIEQVAAQRGRIRQIQTEMEQLEAQLVSLRREGRLLCGQGVPADRQIASFHDVVALLESHGMHVSEDEFVETNRSPSNGLAMTLDRSLDTLAAELERPRDGSTNTRVTYRPEALSGALPSDFGDGLGSGNVSPTRSGRGRRAPSPVREFTVWGQYDAMRSALHSLASQTSEVAVVSVAMQRNANVRPRDLLRWTLVVRLLPNETLSERGSPGGELRMAGSRSTPESG